MEGENILTSQLYNIQETYVFEQTSIDKNLPRCVIDINNRNINVPIEIDSLGVQYDHRSNALIFEIDRYIDDVDLLTQSCIIQWINSGRDGENSGLYPVVMVDSSIEGKLLFCWEIFNESTQFPGNIFFAVRFYSMQDEDTFIWSYNTLPAQSIIEDTLDVVLRASIDIEPSMLELWNARMTELAKVADSSLSTSTYNAKEAEAWAHGRADFPNTIIDNAKYYSEMTKALYEDAKGSVIEEKENVIIAINDAKDESIVLIDDARSNAMNSIEDETSVILSDIEQYGVVQVSYEQPTSPNVDVWIRPDEEIEYSIPEIKDEEVTEEDTWSSKKINEFIAENCFANKISVIDTAGFLGSAYDAVDAQTLIDELTKRIIALESAIDGATIT